MAANRFVGKRVVHIASGRTGVITYVDRAGFSVKFEDDSELFGPRSAFRLL